MKKTLTAVALCVVAGVLVGIWFAKVGWWTSNAPTAPSITSPPVTTVPAARQPAPPETRQPDLKTATGVTAESPAAPKVPRTVTEPKQSATRAEPERKPQATAETPVEPARAPAAPVSEPAPESPRIPEARPPSPPAAIAAPPPPVAASSQVELAAVQRVLDRYKQVYDQLDAGAAASIWPQVDSRALARIFARLKRQNLNFDACVFALSDSKATAQCTGWLSYVPRVGNATPRREQHSWTIELERAGGTWQIVEVNAR